MYAFRMFAQNSIVGCVRLLPRNYGQQSKPQMGLIAVPRNHLIYSVMLNVSIIILLLFVTILAPLLLMGYVVVDHCVIPTIAILFSNLMRLNA